MAVDKTAMSDNPAELSFEVAMQELEQIVSALEKVLYLWTILLSFMQEGSSCKIDVRSSYLMRSRELKR